MDKIAEVFEMQSSDILNLPDDNQSFFNNLYESKKAVVINSQVHAAEVEAMKNHIQCLEANIQRLEANDRFQKELIAKLMGDKG